MKWSTLFWLYLLGFGLTVHAGVYGKSLVSATTWLVTNQNPDGSWGPNQDVQPLYTSAVVHALESESRQQNSYYAGLTWLESRNIKSVDLIARQVDALASHGDDLSSAQTYLQNAQSHIGTSYMGWVLSGFYTSSTVDTALALIANADIGSSAQIQPAIDILKSNQLAGINNQGWAVNNSGSSDPSITALVIQALLPASLPYTVTSAIRNYNSVVLHDAAVASPPTVLAPEPKVLAMYMITNKKPNFATEPSSVEIFYKMEC